MENERLHSTLDRLFDKIESRDQDLTKIKIDLSGHLKESDVRIPKYDSDLCELKIKVEALEKFVDTHEGKDTGKSWVEKKLHWVLSIVLAMWLLIEKFGGLIANGNTGK